MTVRRKIVREFFLKRVSVATLARKYHKTVAQIEDMLRWR